MAASSPDRRRKGAPACRSRCRSPDSVARKDTSLRILHAIHDFLPRHQAGSEIYAFELCRALGEAHHVTLLCADYDPSRPHGQVRWRVYDGLPVAELINNWRCRSFEETYRPPLIGRRIGQVLRAVQPDIVHIHNLLNLSFDLPAIARAQGVPVVATLHDYSLVCPSGGQRVHRAEAYVCGEIDPDRCVRCFRESPFHAQISFGAVTAVTGAPGPMRHAAASLARRFPLAADRLVQAAGRASFSISRADVEDRLASARRLFDDVDLFVAPSPSIATEFERLGIERRKIQVSDYGFVPLQRSSGGPRPGARRSPGPLRIGYVGTLVWHKGVHVLAEAVGQLPSGRYEVKIFGDPDMFPGYTADLRARTASLPVAFMGAFARDRIAGVYAQLDVLVVPSLWLENSPLVIHEAFMAGVPVVGARIGGIADLVEHGRTGLLYDPASPGELASALHALIEQPDLLDALTRHVRAAPRVKTIVDDAREWEETYGVILARREAVAAAP
jgi:glycosyltransferase involved in cell wall biosynthesis